MAITALNGAVQITGSHYGETLVIASPFSIKEVANFVRVETYNSVYDFSPAELGESTIVDAIAALVSAMGVAARPSTLPAGTFAIAGDDGEILVDELFWDFFAAISTTSTSYPAKALLTSATGSQAFTEHGEFTYTLTAATARAIFVKTHQSAAGNSQIMPYMRIAGRFKGTISGGAADYRTLVVGACPDISTLGMPTAGLRIEITNVEGLAYITLYAKTSVGDEAFYIDLPSDIEALYDGNYHTYEFYFNNVTKKCIFTIDETIYVDVDLVGNVNHTNVSIQQQIGIYTAGGSTGTYTFTADWVAFQTTR